MNKSVFQLMLLCICIGSGHGYAAVKHFPLQHQPAAVIIEKLKAYQSETVKLIPAGNGVIVDATPQVLADIEQVLTVLDQPLPTFQVSVSRQPSTAPGVTISTRARGNNAPAFSTTVVAEEWLQVTGTQLVRLPSSISGVSYQHQLTEFQEDNTLADKATAAESIATLQDKIKTDTQSLQTEQAKSSPDSALLDSLSQSLVADSRQLAGLNAKLQQYQAITSDTIEQTEHSRHQAGNIDYKLQSLPKGFYLRIQPEGAHKVRVSIHITDAKLLDEHYIHTESFKTELRLPLDTWQSVFDTGKQSEGLAISTNRQPQAQDWYIKIQQVK